MKIVLITGASRGIGNALAKKFLEHGDFVLGTSTKGDTNLSLDHLKMFQLDLVNPRSIERCAGEIAEFKRRR